MIRKHSMDEWTVLANTCMIARETLIKALGQATELNMQHAKANHLARSLRLLDRFRIEAEKRMCEEDSTRNSYDVFKVKHD